MKNTLKGLVLIWLSSIATYASAWAKDSSAQSSNLNRSRIIIIENQTSSTRNKMRKSSNHHTKAKKSKIKDEEEIVVSASPSTSVEHDSFSEPVVYSTSQYSKENETKISKQNSEIKSKYPRLKRLYFAGNIGYFYTRNNMEFTDVNNCLGLLSADFVCKDTGIARPISLDYKDEYIWSGALGLNTTGPFRFELSYFKLGKDLAITGTNTVDIDTRNYYSNLDLRGGSANLYFDFAAHRRDPYFLFVPYIMGGWGISEISLSDLTFTGSDNATQYMIFRNKQRNKTGILGAGFTIGLNNYVAFDIGYRYYDFGRVKTSPVLQGIIPPTTEDEDYTVNLYDLQLETKLKAHIATIGLRIQI